MLLINDLFPSRRAISQTLIPGDFIISSCTRSSTSETIGIPQNGQLAVITNKSYGAVEVQFYENKAADTITATTGGGDHVSIRYSRVSTIDLGIVALAVIGPEYNTMVDDNTPTDSNGALLIIPSARADLDSIFNKYKLE